MLEDQEILSNKETWKNVLALVPETIQNRLEESWGKEDKTSLERWKELENELVMYYLMSNCQKSIIFVSVSEVV